MDFYEFKRYMQHIEKSLEMQDKYREIMSGDFLDDISGYLIDDVIELLETELETNLISWFVFETEFGKHNTTYATNGICKYSIRTIEELWNVIYLKFMSIF